MTPEEREGLQAVGSLINYYLINVSIDSVSTGVTVGLGVLVLFHLWERGLRTSFKKFMIASVILVPLMSIVEVACYTRLVCILIHDDIVDLKSSESVASVMAPYQTAIGVVESFKLLIADFVVLWRAWVIYTHQRRATILPCILSFIGSLALVITFLALTNSPAALKGDVSQVSTNGAEEDSARPFNSLIIAFTVMSFATNLLSTLAIAVKLYMHFRLFRHMKIKLMPSHRIMLTLVESGLICCCLQLIEVIMIVVTFTTVGGLYFSNVFDVFFYAVLPLFPVAVILLVNTDNTFVVAMSSSTIGNSTTDTETAPVMQVSEVAGSEEHGICPSNVELKLEAAKFDGKGKSKDP